MTTPAPACNPAGAMYPAASEITVRSCASCAQPNRADAQRCIACGVALGPDPGSSARAVAQARASFAQGDTFEARRVLEDGLLHSPDDFGLRFAYVAVLLQEGDFEIGLQHLQD